MTTALDAAPASPPAPLSTPRMVAVLAVIIAADLLDLLDSTITNIAAPTIARDLHGGQGLIPWLGAAYALALGVLLVVGGRLGDRFGRRRMFLLGVAGFTLASLACGVALSPEVLVVARLVQGAFAAVMIPQGFGILATALSRKQMAVAFSVFGPTLGISMVGGPILAGFLIHADLFGLGWRPMFLINIVLGAAAFAAALVTLPRDRGDRAVRIDALGALLLGGAMLGLLLGLITAASGGWTPPALGALGAGAACAVGFVLRQRVAAAPLIAPTLLRNRGFTAGLVLGVVFFAAVAGLMYVISLFLQGGMRLDTFSTSLVFSPVALGIALGSFGGAPLVGRLGRRLVLLGLVLTALGVAALAVVVAAAGAASPVLALLAPLFVIGVGLGGVFGTVFDFAIGDIDPAEAGSASGALSAVQQLANAAGAAGVITVYLGALASGSAAATVLCLTVVGVAVLAACALVALLPRRAAEGGGH